MNNVRDFGAIGDGKTKDTAAIQKAIDAGGMVFFPPGIYLSGTLYLKSDGGLELAPGATLLASPDKEDYNADDFCVQNAVFAKEHVSGAHFIIALEQKNIVIRGGGVIDGNRQAFYNKPYEDWPAKFQYGEWRPGQMVYFCECENIRISDIELNNAPYWTLFLHGCEQANIRALRIWNDHRGRQTDGIDIDCSRFVTVSDCIIHSADDCITLRGSNTRLKQKKACEYVTISNCVLSTPANAFRVGVGNGIVRNCTISNINIQDTRTAVEICSRFSSASEGVTIENIVFDNILMDAKRPFSLSSDAHGIHDDEPFKQIRGIRFNNLNGRACLSGFIESNHRGEIDDVIFSNVNLEYTSGEDVKEGEGLLYAECATVCAPAVVHIVNATRLIFRDFKVRWNTSSPNWKYGIMAQNAEILEISPGCDFGRPMKY